MLTAKEKLQKAIAAANQTEQQPEPQPAKNPIMTANHVTNAGTVNSVNSVKKIGSQLRQIRNAKNLSQYDIGKKAGLSDSTIARIENHGWGSLYSFQSYADALGFPLGIVPQNLSNQVDAEINNL